MVALCMLLALSVATASPASFALDLSPRTAFAQVASGATLSVLASPVEVATGAGGFAAASDGMTVGPGDQVRTTGGGVALLTFFDGSETQLTPDSQVVIQEAAPSAGGPQIGISQVLGTTVDRVQRLASSPTDFSTDTPAATAFVRGTRYTLTVKCYAARPPAPPARLLTFPRRLSDTPYLLAAEVVYDDGGMLWETRAWQDPSTGESFDTQVRLGVTFPEVADQVYQEDDGSYWLARSWQDPATGATWDTYENIGVPVDEQTASSCHPLTSVVLLEGRLEMDPSTRGLQTFDVTPGVAGAASDAATADSPLSPQALQAFDRATSNPRDVAAARTAGQLGGQVADEFASVIVPSAPPGPGGAGGLGGGLLNGLAVRSATADSGLQTQVAPMSPVVTEAAPVVAGTSSPSQPPPPPPGAGQGPPPGGGPVAASAPAPLTSARGASASTSNPSLPPGTIGPNGGSVSLPDGSVTVTFPPGSVSQPTAVQIQPTGAPAPPPAGQQVIGTPVDLTASSGGGSVQNFSPNVRITMTFSGTPPDGIYFFNSNGNTWTRLGDSTVDTTNQTVTATSSHFTVFAMLSAPAPSSTPTSTATPTGSALATATSTYTATPTPSPTPLRTATTTPVTATATPTPTPTASATVLPTPSATAIDTPTPYPAATATATRTATPAPTTTRHPTVTPSPTPRRRGYD